MSQNIESFGKYILLEKVAMGGMAEVYLAKNQGVGGIAKFVAMKRILPQFSESTEFIDMFKDEARIAVNLAHSNIVSIHEFGMEKNQFFIVMDYVEGRNLRQILNKMKKSDVAFSIEQVLYIVKEVAAGLDHAHRCLDGTTGKPLNIIHRDMSPQNVMISFEGEVKIVDFGIAKAETQLETTRAGTLKGKFGYMSPEQAEGQPVDLRTDIFSLGIVLWELLANDRLFVANNEVNTLRKIRDCQVPSLRKINPNIPQELERIVSKALAKDRNLRYQTAAAFQRELSRFLNRQFPDFSPHDFSVFIKTLFSSEILESRKKQIEYAKIELKPEAQQMAQAALDKTVVTNTSTRTEHTQSNSDIIPDFGAAHESEMPPAPKPQPRAAEQQPERPQARPQPPPPLETAFQPESAQASPPPVPTSKRKQDPEIETAGLRVERGAIKDATPPPRDGTFTGNFPNSGGTYYGTRSISRTGVKPVSRFNPSASLMLAIVVAGTLLGGVAYTYANPEKSLTKVVDVLVRVGLYKKPKYPMNDEIKEATEASIASVMVPVTSNPPGAEILIDGKPAELTPTTLEVKLPKDGRKSVKLTLRLSGYLPYEEELNLEGNPSVTAVLQKNKRGFLDINVIGNGQITVNGRLVSMGSPAKNIEVPADQDIVVRAFDPATSAEDIRTIRVAEDKVQAITLIPRGAKVRPGTVQKQ